MFHRDGPSGRKAEPEARVEVKGGKMAAGKKYRGTQDKVILKYVQDMRESLLEADPGRVFITHSGCPEPVIAEVKQYLEALDVFQDIRITRAGGVISSHCGPGTWECCIIRAEEAQAISVLLHKRYDWCET